jgi:hypothetical protein
MRAARGESNEEAEKGERGEVGMTLPLLLVLDHGTALMGLWGLAGEGCAFGVGGGARAPRDIGESGLPDALLSGLAGLTGLVGTPGVSGEK